MDKNSKLVTLWQLIDQVMYLERWLKSPYGFPYMDDANRAAEHLDDVESFLRCAVAHISDGKAFTVKDWDEGGDEDGVTLSEELEEIEKIFDWYSEFELTEENYLDRLESDQDDAGRLFEDFETISQGIKAIS